MTGGEVHDSRCADALLDGKDENDWKNHMNYIHYNPVKHGFVPSPGDWQHSTFRYWVDRGLYEKDWGSVEPVIFPSISGAE